MSRDWRYVGEDSGAMTLRGFLGIGCLCALIVGIVLSVEPDMSFLEQIKAILYYVPFMFCSWIGAFLLLALAVKGLL